MSNCGNDNPPTDNTTSQVVPPTTQVATTQDNSKLPSETTPLAKPVDSTPKEKAVATTASSDLDEKIAQAAKEANEEKLQKKQNEEKRTKAKRKAKRRAERKKKEADRKKAPKKKSKPILRFKETIHHFGTIHQGEKVKHKFVFENIGKAPLIISNATATCGCTQPTFPFIPIEPGEEGYIGVIFDSNKRLGRQKPKVTITTNAHPATYDLYLEGMIDTAKEKEEDIENEEPQ
ncbi:MAG TPA: DUF1573 domain-containing protein [Phaeodactylibacter sp.]|nr:DUF1573 domain-containing protein [Phaeodactylibacter sp.]